MDELWEDEQACPTVSDYNREWKVRYTRLYQQGFRDGLDQGTQLQLQDGFDEGFQVGTSVGKRYGFVEGALQVSAAVSPEEAVQAQIAALRLNRQAEAKQLCTKGQVHSTEPLPPINTSENVLQQAEVLCMQLGHLT